MFFPAASLVRGSQVMGRIQWGARCRSYSAPTQAGSGYPSSLAEVTTGPLEPEMQV